jgi:hypothetical protein
MLLLVTVQVEWRNETGTRRTCGAVLRGCGSCI